MPPSQRTARLLITPGIKLINYKDVIQTHHRLDIDFDQTVALIQQWFPDYFDSAIALWNSFEAQKLGVEFNAQI